MEAMPITGGLVFKMLSEPEAADPNAPRARLGVRARTGQAFQPRSGKPGPKTGGRPKGFIPQGVKNAKKKKKR
jgi:ribonuclease R